MVSARRSFAGELPIAAMPRLCEALASNEGMAKFELDFGRDGMGSAYVDVRVQAPLTMLCQRSLEPFVLPLTVDSRLGLIKLERDEAALPPDCEPLLVAEDGRMNPAEVIEDELLLALPLIPIDPDSTLPAVAQDALNVASASASSDDEEPAENPFAVLRELKKLD